MNRIVFIFFASCCLWLQTSAQATIAKLKYEQAEEAFGKNEYLVTLTKLDEAEKLVGSTNPKIMYLRIMAQHKWLEQNPEKDFEIIEQARKNCTFYLKTYEKIAATIEEKYKEIFLVSEALEKFPKTEADFYAIIKNKRLQQQIESKNKSDADLRKKLTDMDRRIVINKKDAEAFYERSRAKYFLKDTIGAYEDIFKAISFSKKEPKYYERLAYFYKGQKKFNYAYEAYTKAIECNPQNLSDYYYWRATLESDDEYMRKNEAFADYTKSIQLNPNAWWCYRDRAILLYHNAGAKEALSNVEAALKIVTNATDIASLTFYQALCKWYDGDLSGALEAFKKAYNSNAWLGYKVWAARAELLLGKKDKETLNDLKQYVYTTEDTQPLTIVAKYLLGNKKEAFSNAEDIINKAPNLAHSYLPKARLFSVEKDKAKTLEFLNKAYELGYKSKIVVVDPDFKWLSNDADFIALLKKYNVY